MSHTRQEHAGIIGVLYYLFGKSNHDVSADWSESEDSNKLRHDKRLVPVLLYVCALEYINRLQVVFFLLFFNYMFKSFFILANYSLTKNKNDHII